MYVVLGSHQMASLGYNAVTLVVTLIHTHTYSLTPVVNLCQATPPTLVHNTAKTRDERVPLYTYKRCHLLHHIPAYPMKMPGHIIV